MSTSLTSKELFHFQIRVLHYIVASKIYLKKHKKEAGRTEEQRIVIN